MGMLIKRPLDNLGRFFLFAFFVSCSGCINENNKEEKPKPVKIGNFEIEISPGSAVSFTSADSLNGTISLSNTNEINFSTGYIVPSKIEADLISNDTGIRCIKHLYRDVSGNDSIFIITAYDPLDKTNLLDTTRLNYVEMVINNPDRKHIVDFKNIFNTLHRNGEKT